ncbi:hypothetical protein [Mycolicibacterium arenosum]|uniref:Uncharacterized protein n=1 Tax=Mycolicibacterium arenosum TaxID=2952157 RepID=A0ABT1M671_9MYCO|nr:hypothetical protein [Mycolicibacterium sp. CAU 1645]MCP9274661.1 hypothetical protein [Mycolicibacterium sp. CAU 1645]
MTVTHLADHSLLLALPAFAPAVLVVGVVVFVAMRDRRGGEDDGEDGDEAHSDRSGGADQDGAP